MTATSPVTNLMRRLTQTGYTQAFVKSVMPEWWDKSLESSQQSIMMLKMHLSKHLGLDFGSMMDNRKSIQFRPVDNTHYRLTQGKTASDVSLATSMARSIARLVAGATPVPYKAVSEDPSTIRRIIHRSKPWVSFESLLDYAWKHGIPVVHLKKFPSGAKKFDGMVIDIDGRPVIVLARQEKSPSWQSFILAHELGHIGKGHVHDGAVFLDEKVVSASTDDSKENEATEYGLHLLTGDPKSEVRSNHRLKAQTLALAVSEQGRANKIDPGHLALNYGHSMGCMGVARGALNKLPGQYNAIDKITEVLYQNIDPDLLPEDSWAVLETVI